MRGLLIIAVVVVATGIVAASPRAADAPQSQPVELIATPLTKDPSRVVRLINVHIPPGADSGRHHHPGDQYTTVQEGEIHIAIDGQGDKVYKAGDAVHIPPMVVHRTYNSGGKPARTLEVFIVDKDQSLVVKD